MEGCDQLLIQRDMTSITVGQEAGSGCGCEMKDPVLAWNWNQNVQSVTSPFNDKNVPAFRPHLQTYILLFETCQRYNSILDRKQSFLLFHYTHNPLRGPPSLFPTQRIPGALPPWLKWTVLKLTIQPHLVLRCRISPISLLAFMM
jgi:hypothetical protein